MVVAIVATATSASTSAAPAVIEPAATSASPETSASALTIINIRRLDLARYLVIGSLRDRGVEMISHNREVNALGIELETKLSNGCGERRQDGDGEYGGDGDEKGAGLAGLVAHGASPRPGNMAGVSACARGIATGKCRGQEAIVS